MDFTLPPSQTDQKQPSVSDATRKLIRDFKVLALSSLDAAVFKPQDCELIAQAVNENPNIAREDWLAAAKAIIGEMNGEFEFKHCGQTLSQMLEAKVIQIEQKRKRDAQHERDIQASQEAAMRAAKEADEAWDAEYKRRQEEGM
jgi:hypothetical protein